MVPFFVICLVVVAMISSIPLLHNRLYGKNIKIVYICIFTVYVVGSSYFALLSRVPTDEMLVELRPFASYEEVLRKTGDIEWNELRGWFARYFMQTPYPVLTIILNILLYVPLGYLLPELFHKLSGKQILLISFLATFCTELTQLIFKLGWCETDDLIHNMLGAVIGLAIHRWQEKKGILNTQN